MISEFFFPLWGDNDYVCEIVPPYSNKLLNPTSPPFKKQTSPHSIIHPIRPSDLGLYRLGHRH